MNDIQNSIIHHFHNLVGSKGIYEGANEQELIFKFDDILWKAIEDELDGYRSMLDYVVYADNDANRSFICHKNLANVVLESVDESEQNICFAGYVLKDIEDNHIWLRIGTAYVDEYYPYTIFQHIPKLDNV
jgi:hypothetical protein